MKIGAASQASPRGADAGQHGRRRENHQRPAGKARGGAPSEEPGEVERESAGEEGEGGQRHRSSKNRHDAHARRDRTSEKRAGEIAGKIGRAQIGGGRRLEPVRADDGRQERRIGEAGETDSDQARAEGAQNPAPHGGVAAVG